MLVLMVELRLHLHVLMLELHHAARAEIARIMHTKHARRSAGSESWAEIVMTDTTGVASHLGDVVTTSRCVVPRGQAEAMRDQILFLTRR